ncbi:ABC transporter ATP-binding protein [Antarctobacter heliothermus]|uniref:ABC transporter ATP-binding protein n=1 Tax=Antarctobacter heliothermus TaxID=74033 RepID=A0A222E4W2_9RHOB|nr:ABC transporter ATP-binding protein [Antarctobacter heliothermus]ASP21235.1 ABC transporter ATP-binding protein [Antarctobacter heliothermus]
MTSRHTTSLSLTDVDAGYGKVAILSRLSFATDPGGILTILGANGSGKSTCLKALMGLASLTGGTIRLGDEDITKMPVHRRVSLGLGYVPQVDNVFGDLSVDDNLRMGAFLHPQETPALREQALELFPQLKPHLRKAARLLSGGERRMLSIAQTLMIKPRILLMDEPSSDLSPKLVEEVFACITDLRERMGIPVLLVEQNVTHALRIADRVIVLAEGSKVLDRPTEAVTLDELGEIFLGRHPVTAQQD